jgi:carbon-monoxide dehydrogenase small subunit
MKEISFILNGEDRKIHIQPYKTLADVLRYQMGLKSLKCGCERGDCGTCTVWVNDKPVRSCLILGVEAAEQKVTTLEGLMKDGKPTPLQLKLHGDNAYQCGFCAPGMLMSLEALMRDNKKPDEEEIKEAIAGNLCRCTGYSSIVESVQELISSSEGEAL